MPAGLIIRDCTRADLAAVQAIYAPEVLEGTASFETAPPDLAEITARFETIKAKGLPYLVAELEGQVAGFAYAGPYRTRPAYRFTAEDAVYVGRAARRQGVGLALLEALIREATAAGIRQMVAIVGDSAHLASIRATSARAFAWSARWKTSA